MDSALSTCGLRTSLWAVDSVLSTCGLLVSWRPLERLLVPRAFLESAAPSGASVLGLMAGGASFSCSSSESVLEGEGEGIAFGGTGGCS